MNNLVRYDNEGLELLINQKTGEVFASQRAIARMVGVSDSTIGRWKGVAQIQTLEAEVPTAGGLQGAALFNEDAIYEAFAKYNPDLLVQCAKAGIRVYLHTLAGYAVTSSAVVQQQETNKQLSSREEALETAITVDRIDELLSHKQPKLAQFLIDHAISDLMSKNVPMLT